MIRRLIPSSLKPALRRIFRMVKTPMILGYCRYRGVRPGKEWEFIGLPRFRKSPGAVIEIGDRFKAVSRFRGNSIGVIQPVLINAWGSNSRVIIGSDVGMSGCTITAMKEIRIGNRVLVGSGVLINDSDSHPIHPDNRHDATRIGISPVVIGDDVFIGARAIILKGVHIGKGAVVGAGAVVAGNVPDFGIAVGNPARVVGDVRNHA